MSKVYLVTYDLNSEGQDYEGIKSAIKQYECCYVMQSVWLVYSTKTASGVYDTLEPYIDKNDWLYVVEITSNRRGRLPSNVCQWIKERLNK
jgi:hypothetical protein